MDGFEEWLGYHLIYETDLFDDEDEPDTDTGPEELEELNNIMETVNSGLQQIYKPFEQDIM